MLLEKKKFYLDLVNALIQTFQWVLCNYILYTTTHLHSSSITVLRASALINHILNLINEGNNYLYIHTGIVHESDVTFLYN